MEKLTDQYNAAKGVIDELNATAQEVRAKIIEMKKKVQDAENEIESKQKAKDDTMENMNKRGKLVEYYRKQSKIVTDALVQYEVSKHFCSKCVPKCYILN